jgi:hypothetical protein
MAAIPGLPAGDSANTIGGVGRGWLRVLLVLWLLWLALFLEERGCTGGRGGAAAVGEDNACAGVLVILAVILAVLLTVLLLAGFSEDGKLCLIKVGFEWRRGVVTGAAVVLLGAVVVAVAVGTPPPLPKRSMLLAC